MSSSDQYSSEDLARLEAGRARVTQSGEVRDWEPKRALTPDQITDLQRLANGDPEALDEEYGFNNDELLRLGIGYGIPGPLSDEQVRREAAEILSELEQAR